MKAWTVAVIAQSQKHGQMLSSTFHLAETRAEAIAAGVRSALAPHDCVIFVTMAIACELASDVVAEAAAAMAPREAE